MATLSVRKLNDSIYEQLRVRATQHGISMEEEVRRIITQAVSAPNRVSEVFRKHFGLNNGIDLDILKQPQITIALT